MENEIPENLDQVENKEILSEKAPINDKIPQITHTNKSLLGRLAHMFGHNSRYDTPNTDINSEQKDIVGSPDNINQNVLSTDKKLFSLRRRTEYPKDNKKPSIIEYTTSIESSELNQTMSPTEQNISRRAFLKTAVGVAGAGLISNLPEKAFAQTDETKSEDRNLESSINPTGDPHFDKVWREADEKIARGSIQKPWTWGPEARSKILKEPYEDSPGGERRVVYFDKSRMEITNPDGNPDSEWYVTNGLLPLEMITGKIQTGNNKFENREPARVNIVGDLDDPNGVTYASLRRQENSPESSILSPKEKLANGTRINSSLDREGNVSESSVESDVSVSAYDDTTKHNIAKPFWDYMNNGDYDNPYYTTGRPLTEPYWVEAKIGGTPKKILMQVFERRCLTFDPTNQKEWQVEAGNVGLQYYKWRYETTNLPSPETEHEQLKSVNAHINEVLKEVVSNQNLRFFDKNFTNSLPEHYTQEINDHRHWMGAHLTNTGIILGINGEYDNAVNYINKSWSYLKEKNQLFGDKLPDNTSVEVFPVLEFILALKLHGQEIEKRNPELTNEIITKITEMADNYTSQGPAGNDETNIRRNSFGETNAGISAHLLGTASLIENHPNRNKWIESAHSFAKATFATGSPEENGIQTVVVDEHGDFEFYNHEIISDHYLATSLGLLGEARLFAKMGNIPTGPELSHNVDRARNSLIKHIDDNFKYTRPQYKVYDYYDEYGQGVEHQEWDGDAPAGFLNKKSKKYSSEFYLRDKEINPSYGPLSRAFLDYKDPAFRDDMEAYFGSIEYMRLIVQGIQSAYRLNQPLEIAGYKVNPYTYRKK